MIGRLQVVGFFPVRAKRWGEVLTLMVTPQRPVQPFRLVVPSACASDYVVTRLRINTVEQLHFGAEVPACLFAAPAVASRMYIPALRPSGRAELTIRAVYVKPRRPWLQGSRARRKTARARFWSVEARRLPVEFLASLLCEGGE